MIRLKEIPLSPMKPKAKARTTKPKFIPVRVDRARGDPIRLTLPVPPALNRYLRHWGNRVVKTQEARDYEERVGWLCKSQRVTMYREPVAVSIVWYRGRRAGDLDGRAKLALDSLQGHAYENDSQVRRLTMEMHDTDRLHPRIEVVVQPYEEAA